MPRKQVPARQDWALENAGDDLRPEREEAERQAYWEAHHEGLEHFIAYIESLLTLPRGYKINIVVDLIQDDGWRHIDIWVTRDNQDQYELVSVWFAPGAWSQFPPDLDIPF